MTYKELKKKSTAIKDALYNFDGTKFEICKYDERFCLFINGQISLGTTVLREIESFAQGAEWAVDLLVGIKKKTYKLNKRNMIQLTKDKKSDNYIVTRADKEGYHRELTLSYREMCRLTELIFIQIRNHEDKFMYLCNSEMASRRLC